MNYRIENRDSGVNLGVFSGSDELSAMRAMLKDAGSDEEPSPDLIAYQVPEYCIWLEAGGGLCRECNLSNYARDCENNPIRSTE